MRPGLNLENKTVYTAVITPLTEHQSIDFASLKSLLKEQERAGNGVLILGSTGESLNLSLDQRKQIVLYTMEQRLNVPVMVGVGGIQLPAQQEWLRWLNSQNVDSYLLVTPLYAKPGKEGQVSWFQSLLDLSDRPCMLYNVPGRTGVSMDKEALAELQSHPRAWAVKEASGCAKVFSEYRAAAPQLEFFCGDDILVDEFIDAGAKGLVSVASNAWPEITNRVVQELLNRTMTTLPEEFRRASQSLFLASNPVPVKALLYELGRIRSPWMLPPLSHRDLANVGPVVVCHKELLQLGREKGWLRTEENVEVEDAVA